MHRQSTLGRCERLCNVGTLSCVAPTRMMDRQFARPPATRRAPPEHKRIRTCSDISSEGGPNPPHVAPTYSGLFQRQPKAMPQKHRSECASAGRLAG
jgi:hypothetical protein